MATATVQIPYADASPAQLREAILPEDVPAFDVSFQRALDEVGRTRRLDALESFLAHWRRIARSATANGHDAWRAALATADRIRATGQPTPGARPWDEVKAELGV